MMARGPCQAQMENNFCQARQKKVYKIPLKQNMEDLSRVSWGNILLGRTPSGLYRSPSRKTYDRRIKSQSEGHPMQLSRTEKPKASSCTLVTLDWHLVRYVLFRTCELLQTEEECRVKGTKMPG
jgi:hypothetical protein